MINTEEMMCARGICPPVVDGVLVRFDRLHITGAFARLISSALGDLLVAYLPHAPA
jgi:hypothetical protein